MRILIKELAEEVTQQDLLHAAKEFGRVNSVTLVRDVETRKPNGTGYIEMASEEEGEAAMEGLRGLELKGQKITVEKSEGELVQKHSAATSHKSGLPGAGSSFGRGRGGSHSSRLKGGGGASRGR